MKKIIYTLFIFSAFACSSNSNGLKINGTVKGLENGTVQLELENGTALDTVDLDHGRFSIGGQMTHPQNANLYIYDQENKFRGMGTVFTNNEQLSFSIDVSSKDWNKIDASCKFTGARLDEEYAAYRDYIAGLKETVQIHELSDRSSVLYEEGKIEESETIDRKANELQFQVISKVLSYKEDSKMSPIAIAHVCSLASDFSLEDQIRISKMFDAQFKDSYHLNEFRLGIEREKKIAIGQPAADFRLQDLEGHEYSLDSFKGKYLYMDFSASWCGWCHAEVPYIRAAYNKFKDENIVFVTVNMDDNREDWEKDAQKQKYDWLCIGNAEGMDSELAHNYNIHGIPSIFIIDPEGKIVLREVRRESLIPTLTKLLNK